MFIYDINPVFLQVGPVQLRYYGLVYFLGFLFIYFYFRHIVRKRIVKGLDQENLELFMIYAILGVIIGARVLDFVFYNPALLFSDPLEVLRIWHGGMSFHGGLIGLFVAIYIFSKRHKVGFYDLADRIAMPAIFFLAIGRIANFINGELPGTKSNLPWCVVFPGYDGCRHPYQLYESLKNFAVLGILFLINKSKKLKAGLLMWWTIFLYNSLRFFVDFFRDEPRLMGISMGQFLCMIFTIVSAYMLIKLNSTNKSSAASKQKN